MSDELDQRLALVRSLPLFQGLTAAAQAEVAELVEWFSFPGGVTLFEAGDAADALYVVINGCLGAFARMPSGERRLIARIAPGETVGEMALLTGRPRNAAVVSLRDTELVRFSRDAFERLIVGHPSAMLDLARLSVNRLERSRELAPGARSPRTLAILPQSAEVDAGGFAERLVAELSQGRRVACVRPPAGELPETQWFHSVEDQNDCVVYVAEPGVTPWSQFCVRQADALLLVVQAATPPGRFGALSEGRESRATLQRAELVLLHDGAIARGAARRWLARYEGMAHHHVRGPGDIARLARLLTGRAVGLVLSGGAARGFAHVGVIRALREHGIPIDLVGGTSIGAIVGAAVASEWSDAEILRRFHRTFVAENPLGDYTLPVVSLVSGRRVNRLLEQEFGGLEIEDLPLPFFCCSTNLTQGKLVVHRTGELWRWLRASIAIPGVLPPVIHAGELFVDGGLMRNLPIDVLQEMGPGRVIAVDVTPGAAIRVAQDSVEAPSVWNSLPFVGGRRSQPGILHILLRSAMVNSTAAAAILRDSVDLLFRPPLEGLDLMDWRGLERVAEAGYRHARERLKDGVAGWLEGAPTP
jgi:NTE family protein